MTRATAAAAGSGSPSAVGNRPAATGTTREPVESGKSPVAPDRSTLAIKARCDAASAGPWYAKEYRVYAAAPTTNRLIAACWRPWGPVTGDGSIEADATFIAHARTDVPALVAEVERLGEDLRIANEATLVLTARAAAAEATIQRIDGRPGYAPDAQVLIDSQQAEIVRLGVEIERLRAGGSADCVSVMQFGGVHYACDYPAGHDGPHGGVYPNPTAAGDDVFGQWP